MISRRTLLASAAPAFATLAWPAAGHAQTYPTGPVRVLVPFPPGGATDVLGRVLTFNLQALWGQTVVQDYRPGAAGLLGTRQVMATAPDGYNLLLASTGAILALASSQNAGAGYSIEHDLAPISLLAAPPYILVVNPSVPAHTAVGLIALARKSPGKLTFGSSGTGSATHLSGALFEHMADVKMLHVPYRGTGPATTDLLGGRIDMMFAPAVVVSPHIAAGKLRAIGTTTPNRSALYPDIPTIAETGLAGYESLGWFGLFAPGKTPPDLVARLSADTAKVLMLPDSKKRMAEQGAEPEPNSPQAFTTFVNAEIVKWIALAKQAGINLTP